MTASEFSVGLVHELVITASKVGFEPKDFAALAHSEEKLSKVLGYLHGSCEIRPIDHLIDLSLPCKLPFEGAIREKVAHGGVVKLEKRSDDLYLDGRKIVLHLSQNQKDGKVIGGHKLRKELETRGGNIGGRVLDYLVDHPELWPESWKKDAEGRTIFVYFWEDIFRDPSSGNLFVRCGYWHEGEVVSRYDYLGNDWRDYDPADSSASES